MNIKMMLCAVLSMAAASQAWGQTSPPSFTEAQSRACEQIVAQRADVVAEHEVTVDPGCIDAGDAAWVVNVERYTEPVPDFPADFPWVRWSLVHVDANGAVVAQYVGEPSDRLQIPPGVIDELPVIQMQVFDYNGDGQGEVFVHATQEIIGGIDDAYVMTFRDGAIQPFDGMPSGHVVRAEDVDLDGRLDIVLRSSFGMSFGCENDSAAWGPELIAHSLSDGTFSMTDAVARSLVVAECPIVPDHLVDAPDEYGYFDGYATINRLTCARFWGQSPEAVVAQLQAELEAHGFLTPESLSSNECQGLRPELLREMAAQPVPFTLAE